MARLLDLYKAKIIDSLKSEFGYRNLMQVPKLEKIIVSMGVGKAATDKKLIVGPEADLKQITGQKPFVCKARKSVSNYKTRIGMDIGLKVTMRGRRMYEFLDRLISLAVPRVRDFRGLSPNAFDGHGNYSLGLAEQLVFPELNPDKYSKPQGMNVTLVTSTDRDEEARELLRKLGLPLRTA